MLYEHMLFSKAVQAMIKEVLLKLSETNLKIQQPVKYYAWKIKS